MSNKIASMPNILTKISEKKEEYQATTNNMIFFGISVFAGIILITISFGYLPFLMIWP